MAKKAVLLIFKIYQKVFSPDQGIFRRSVPTCRFFPSCSQYGIEAVEKFDVIKGLKLLIKRILKCHPLNPGGFDYVPKS